MQSVHRRPEGEQTAQLSLSCRKRTGNERVRRRTKGRWKMMGGKKKFFARWRDAWRDFLFGAIYSSWLVSSSFFFSAIFCHTLLYCWKLYVCLACYNGAVLHLASAVYLYSFSHSMRDIISKIRDNATSMNRFRWKKSIKITPRNIRMGIKHVWWRHYNNFVIFFLMKLKLLA